MKILVGLLLALAPVVSLGQTAEKLTPVRHDFVIKNFHTESGVTLPEVHVIYGTYGHLNAAKDNVVLLPSHYMAKFRGYEWLMGPGKALDPNKLSGVYGALCERKLLLAEQHAGTLPWIALPADDDSRQRERRPSTVD